MPVFYDPYTALQFAKQGQALGGKPVNPNMYEAMGYGVTAAMADKEAQGRGLALQEKSQAERTREFNINAELENKKYTQGLYGSAATAALQTPITYYSAQKLGILPEDMGIQSTVKGWFGSGESAPATATPAMTSGAGLGPVEAATTSGMPAQEYASMGGTAMMNTAGSSQSIATSGMPAGEFAAMSGGEGATAGTTAGGVGVMGYAAPAVAGYYGAKHGPDLGSNEVGKAMATGVGLRGNKKVQAAASGSIKGAGAGAVTGTMIAPGIGTIIGTIVGGVAGGIQGGTGTVICTELHRQGYISVELLDFEHIYQPHFDWQTYWGYRIWADPIVKGMKKSKVLTKIVSMFGVPFIKEVAHRVDPARKGSWFGTLLIKFGVPFCRWNYRRYQRKFGKFCARFKVVKEG